MVELASRLRRLSPPEWRVLALALVGLPLCAAALRFAGLARVRSVLAKGRRGAHGPHRIDAESVARIVHAAARRRPFRTACLARALVVQWILARQGIPSELRIGVRKAAGKLEAHAWVEAGGLVLAEVPGRLGFAALAEPAAARTS